MGMKGPLEADTVAIRTIQFDLTLQWAAVRTQWEDRREPVQAKELLGCERATR